MLMQSRAAAAPPRMRHAVPLQLPDPWGALRDCLGPMEDEVHIVILGTPGPDAMCSLLRAGARQVTQLRTHERLEQGSASLVIVPRLISFDWLAGALAPIRRALMPNGRIAMSIDALPSTQRAVRGLLASHGLTAIRASRAAGRQVLTAELPAFGLRRCA